MTSAATQRWKNLEKKWEKMLCRFKVPAKRRTRGNDWAESTDDVEIIGHPTLRSDTKYSTAGFKVNRLHAVMEEKYCPEDDYFAILLTAGYKERGMKAMVEGEFMAMLISHWLGYGTKEELMDIYLNGPKKEKEENE